MSIRPSRPSIIFVALALSAILATAAAANWSPGWSLGLLAPSSENKVDQTAVEAPPQSTTAPDDAPSAIYFSEGFEGTWFLNGNSGTPATAAGPNAPSTWTQTRTVNNVAPSGCSTSGGHDWGQMSWSGTVYTSVNFTGTSDSGCSPFGGAPTAPPEGTKVMWFYDGWTSSGNTRRIESPAINLSASASPVVSFSYSYAGGGVANVVASLDGGVTWTSINTIAATASGTWATKVVVIPWMYKVANAKIGFQIASTFGSFDAFVDNVIVRDGTTPANAAPTTFGTNTVTASSMNVTWVDNSTNETSFNLYRSTDNVNFTLINNVASSTSATTGTTYTAGQAGLTAGLTYFYRIAAATAEGESATQLTGSQATTSAATYYYVGAATGSDFSTAASWTVNADGTGGTRTTPLATDILIIDGIGTTNTAGGITIGMAASQSLGALQITNSTAVTLQSTTSTSRTVTLTGSVGDELSVPAGSSLILNNATNAVFVAFSTGTGMTGTIAGTLTFGGSTSNTLTTTGGTGTVVTVISTGVVNLGADTISLVGSTSSLIFANGSNCNASGSPTSPKIPLATWGATSNITITGLTSASPSTATNNAQSFGNFVFNCPSLAGTLNFWATTTTASIQGTLTIQATGTGRFRAMSSGTVSVGALAVSGGTFEAFSSTGTLTITGNVTQTGGTFDVSSATSAGSIKLAGNYTQSGAGVLTDSGSTTSLNPVFEFNGTSAQTLTLVNAVTGAVNMRINNSAGVTLSGTLALNGLTVSNGNISGGTIAYNASTSKLQYNSTTGTQTANATEFPASSGPVNLTINNTATSPNNSVTLPFARSLPLAGAGVLTMTAGLLNTTSSNLLTLLNTASGAVSGGSATAYVNGPLARTLPASISSGTYTFPIGKSAYNLFELVTPTTNAGGTVTIQAEEFDANSGGTAGTGIASLNTNRYWNSQITSGAGNFTNTTVRVTENPLTGNRLGQSATQGGSYNSVTGTVSSPTILSTTITSLGFFNLGNQTLAGGTYNVCNGAPYPTLKSFFDDVNSLTVSGTLNVVIAGDCPDTVPAVLNQWTESGVGGYFMNITPSGNRTISAAIAAGSPLIDLNGADRVTIDGLNSGGNSLTISNTTASGTLNTSTIRFRNDATGNTVTNATILGSSSMSTTTGGGTVFFSTGTTTGNDNNTISNCDIGPAGGTLPTRAIFGSGSTASAAINNSGILINNNNIRDFFSLTASVSGIYVFDGNDAWTISNNRVYQTVSRTFTSASLRYAGITLNPTVSPYGAFTVTGNTIGFANSAGTGVTTITGSSNDFRGIDAQNVNDTTPTSIQGNTISGINQTTSNSNTSTPSAPFIGIALGTSSLTGRANIGTTNGNTIGSLDGSSTIVFNGTSVTASTQPVMGILDYSSSTNSISNNNIGSITIQSTGATVGFKGIYVFTDSSHATTINNNKIVSVTDTQTGGANGYQTFGVYVNSPAATVTGNTISNISSATSATGIILNCGILVTNGSSAANSTVSQNSVSGLSVANSTSGQMCGFNLSFPTATANTVSRNIVHSLTWPGANAQIDGIDAVAGTTTYSNNMVGLGNGVTTSATILGINESGSSNTNNFYHNSVYLAGTGVATSSISTIAFSSNVTANARNYRDNIFFNARSNATGTGKHYAISVGGSGVSPAGLNSNNNDLYASGTGGAVGFYSGSPIADIATWRSTTGQDAQSVNNDPQLRSFTDLHIKRTSPAVASPVENVGFAIGITNDYDNDTPRSVAASPNGPDIGADEVNGITFAAGPFSGSEGNALTPVTVTVNRAPGSGSPATVQYGTGAGTATGGGACATPGVEDYINTSGTLNFAAGDTSKSFVINICPDTVYEGDETVNLILANVTGGSTLITSDIATLTITEDDPAPVFTIGPATVTHNEGAPAAMTQYDFTVTKTGATVLSSSVEWFTQDGTAISASGDYGGVFPTTLTFPASMTTDSQTVTVMVNGDGAPEPDEDFLAKLQNPTNATLGGASQAQGVITNDDFLLTVTINGTGSGTVSSMSPGISCPGDCTEGYQSGTSVTLNAFPGIGSTFTGWSGGTCSGALPFCTFTVTGTTGVTATFDTVVPTPTPTPAPTPQTYVWIGGTLGSWIVPGNWSSQPGGDPRLLPLPGDTLIFDGSQPSSTFLAINSVPTETEANIQVINLVHVGLEAALADTELTVTNQLSIEYGSDVVLQGTNDNFDMVVASAQINGGFEVDLANDQLRGNGITFQSNSFFNTAPGYTGYPFGNGTTEGTPGSVSFLDGSAYFHSGGSSPFGLSAPPVVAFSPDSKATFLIATGFEADGRTYGDLQIGSITSGSSVTATDGGPNGFTFYDLTVESAGSTDSTLTYNGTGSANVNIHGDININGDGDGNDSNPGVVLTAGNGSVIKGLSQLPVTGSISVSSPIRGGTNDERPDGPTPTITFSHDSFNTRRVQFNGDADIVSSTALNLQTNVEMTGAFTLTANGPITGSVAGYVIGNLKRAFTPVAGQVTVSYPIGTSNVNPINGYSPIDATYTLAGPSDQTIKAVAGPMLTAPGTNRLQRYWTYSQIEPSGGNADLTFHYPAVDAPGTPANYLFYKDDGITVTPLAPASPPTSTQASINGVSSFSNWTLAEPVGATPTPTPTPACVTPSVVYIGEDSPTDFTITTDVGTPGLSLGDTVNWNPGGGQHPAGQVNGLIFGCNAFTSIDAGTTAVSDGGTANVEAGLYTGDVNVNKSVTFRGAKMGVNPNDGSWNDTRTVVAAEATVHGAVNLSLQNVIVFDGFTLERTASSEGHILIGSGNPTGIHTTSSFDIRNNRFVGTRSTGAAWAGIHTNFLDDSGAVNPGNQFLAHQNRIEISGTSSGSGILVNANRPGSDNLGSTTITNNYVANTPDNGINVNRSGAFLTLTGNYLFTDDIFTFKIHNALISNNTVINSPQGSIQITASSAEDSSNVTVSNNTVTNNVALLTNNFSQIDVRGPLTGTNFVTGNSVTLSGVIPGGLAGIYGVRVRGTSATGVSNLTVNNNALSGGSIGGAGNANFPPTSGVFVDTDLLTSGLDLHVTNNFVNGWTNAASVYDTNSPGPGAFGNLPIGAIFQLFNNDLSGNSALVVQSGTGETVDASSNWWGTIVEASVAALTAGPVDFTPYLNVGTDTNGSTGFQGDLSTLHVTALGGQAGATGRIQEGINTVTAAGTVLVHTGTYAGNADATAKAVILSAGASPGQVTINGNLILTSDDNVPIEINGTNAATQYDNFIVNGTVTLGNATLSLTGTHNPVPGQTFTIIDNDMADAVSGTFSGLTEGAVIMNFLGSGLNASITYMGGTNSNDVVLTVLPPTSTPTPTPITPSPTPTPAACYPPPGGMVAWYPGENDLADPLVNDIAGTNEGTEVGGLTYEVGMVGQAFAFDGTTGYFSAPASTSLDVGTGTGMTIDAWIKPTDDFTSQRPIVEWNNGTNIASHFWHSVTFSGAMAPADLYVNLVDTTGAQHIFYTNPSVLTQGMYSHVAFTYVKSTGVAQIFVNGLPVAVGTDMAAPSGTSVVLNGGVPFTPRTNYDLYVGHRPTNGLEYFKGAMDEIEVFNRALTPAEVLGIATAGGTGKCHTSMVQFATATQTVNESAGTANLVVTRDGANDSALTVAYTVSSGTAIGDVACTAGVDFITPTAPLNFAIGQSSQSIAVTLCNDAAFEGSETFSASLTGVTSGPATIGSPSGETVAITDDETQPTLSIALTSGGAEPNTPNVFTVTLSGQTTQTVTVDYATSSGNAIQGTDFTSTFGTLTFAANTTTLTQTISVPTMNDFVFEGTEFFNMTLSNPSNAPISGSTVVQGVITDDETQPTVSISRTQDGAEAGMVPNVFTITLSGQTAQQVKIDYATSNNSPTPSAMAGQDYIATSGQITFAANATILTQTVSVSTLDDLVFEGPETFTMTLSNPVNTTIGGTNPAFGLINDNDLPTAAYVGENSPTDFTITNDVAPPGLSSGDTVTWNPGGTQHPQGAVPNLLFNSQAFTTIQGGVDAVAPGGTVYVEAGAYTENVTVTRSVIMSGAQFGVDARGRVGGEATVTPATAGNATFLLNASMTATSIDGFSFSGGTSLGVIQTQSGSDFSNLQIKNNRFSGYSQSALFMNRGGSNMTIDKNVMDGSNISGSGQAIFCNTQTFNGLFITNNNIINNTGRYGFFVDGIHNVGESATRAPSISGNLFNNNLQGLNLGSRSFGTNGTPVLGTYGGTISNNTFSNHAANGIQAGIQHVLVSGNLFSNNPTAGLALTSFGNAGADRGAQNSTISGNCFTGNGTAIVFSGTQAAGTISTNHANQNNIAGNTIGASYTGTETIDATNNYWGSSTGPTNAGNPGGSGDSVVTTNPGTITFTPFLTTPAAIAGCTLPPTLTITRTTAGAEPNVANVFTVTISSSPTSNVTVHYATSDGTALAGSDYTATSGNFTFTAGTTTLSQTFSVPTLNDSAFELTENFTATLSLPVNATLETSSAQGIITDDDPVTAAYVGENLPSDFTITTDTAPPGLSTGDTVTWNPGGTQHPQGAVPNLLFNYQAFTTIQGGITAVVSAGTVYVEAGTYSENVILNKNVTMSGAQFNIDARTRPGTNEAIISPTAAGRGIELQTGSASAVINGFTISGGARSIESTSGPLNNMSIANNRVVGFTGSGFFLNDNGTDMTISQNLVDGASKTGSGDLFHLDTDSFAGLNFTNNRIVGKGATDLSSGFFVDGNHNVGPSAARSPLISGNTITACQTGMNLGTRAFGSLTAPTVGTPTISNNGFTNNLFDGLQGGMQFTLITGNIFSGNGRHGLALTSFGNTGSDRGAQNDTVTGNCFTSNGFQQTGGAGVLFSSTQAAGTIATNHVNQNNIAGNNIGASYAGAETVDAANNYWGSSTGPTNAGNPGGSGDSVVYTGTGGGITFTPFRTTPAAIASCSLPPTLTIARTTIGAEPSTASVFTVTISSSPTSNVTVHYATSNGTAAAGSDYTSTSGDITFTAGTSTLSQTFSVPTLDDIVFEGQENYTATLSLPVNATLETASAQGLINDNETQPTLSITRTTPGGEPSTANVFTITLSGQTTQPVSVTFATSDNSPTPSAVAGQDYTATTTPVNFAAGTTTLSQTVSVPTLDDLITEGPETFTATLSGATNAPISVSTASGLIADNEGPPTVSISRTTDGAEPSTANVFTITLSNQTTSQVTVNYATSDNSPTPSAVAGQDYTATTGTKTFAANTPTLTQTFSVATLDDVVFEGPETFTATLSGATNATVGGGPASGLITDNESQPTLSIARTTDGAEPSTANVFTITLSGQTAQQVTVNYATSDGSATSGPGNDFTATSGTKTFAAGTSTLSQTFSVPTLDDNLFEGTENFTASLSNATNAPIGSGSAQGVIIDNEGQPTVSISTMSIGAEPGTANVFAITLSGQSTSTVTVKYATASGTAAAGTDFTDTTGTVTFPANTSNTTQTVSVPTLDDLVFEGSENFTMALSNPVNTTIAGGTASGTISDNENPPTFAIGNISGAEGNAGTTPFTFTITKTGLTQLSSTVTFNTVDGTATVANNDYQPIGSSSAPEPTANDSAAVAGSADVERPDAPQAGDSVVFGPNDTTKTVSVLVNGDLVVEPNETFKLHINNVTNGQAPSPDGTATIINDDVQATPSPTPTPTVTPTPTPTVTPSPTPSASPSPSPSPTPTPSPSPSASPCNGGGTTTVAADAASLGAIPDSDLTTPACQNNSTTKKDVTFTVTGQTGTVSNVSVNFSASHTYLQDLEVSLIGPGGSPTHLLFSATGTTTTVVNSCAGSTNDLSTANIYTFNDAASANWWTTAAANPVPTSTNRTVVTGIGGTSNPPATTTMNTTFAGGVPNGVWTLRFRDRGAGDTGTVTAANLTLTTTAPCATPSPTPTATPSPTTSPGITPSPTPTRTPTPTPTPTVTPTPTPTATPSPSPTPTPGTSVQFSASAYMEDESQTALITVTRTGPLTGTSSVNYATTNGTAMGGGSCATTNIDYVSASGTLTFAPNNQSQTFTVEICRDNLTEPDQTVALSLSTPVGTVIGSPSTAILTINDTATQFENQTNIAINDGGPSSPYPSEITVANGPPVIGSMRITVYDYSTTLPINVGFLLVGPTGTKYVLMANAGGFSPINTPVTLNFTDTAAQVIPANTAPVTADYEPTSYGIVGAFPAPAPAPPYNLPGGTVGGTGTQTLSGNFTGTNSNGIWRLYVKYSVPPPFAPEALVGQLAGGWGIEFFAPTAAQASISGRVLTAEGQPIRNARVVVTGNSLSEPRTMTTGSFGYFSIDGLTVGETYVVTVNSQRFTFTAPSRVITLVDNVFDADFVADPLPDNR